MGGGGVRNRKRAVKIDINTVIQTLKNPEL